MGSRGVLQIATAQPRFASILEDKAATWDLYSVVAGSLFELH